MSTCPGCARELPSQEFPFCPWCGQSLDGEPPSGQRKTLTVLFADLVDSTVLGSTVDPEVLRGVLAEYWECSREAVEAHGGKVEKFIGDAVVGVFGVPVVREDDALRAVRAAVDLREAVASLSRSTAARVGVALAVRIGVNTGEVLAGDGLDVLMTGDAANVAARLQTSASPGQVLVGEVTYRLVRDDVTAVPLEPFAVKGKSERVTAFDLLSVTPPSRPARRRRRYSGPMLARERQMALAQNLFDTAVEGSTCAVLTVVGEPGVGKSRLVDELLEQAATGATVLNGRCLPYGEGMTLSPLADMVGRLDEQREEPWQALLVGDPFADRVAEGLDALVSGGASASLGELGWAFRRMLESLARDRPVVVVVDDLQWGQPGLVELLAGLPTLLRASPVVLVVMARPELVAAAGWTPGGSNTCTVTLPPLPSVACRDLVGQMLGPDVGEELKTHLAEAAGGIPLFIEETVAMMVDDGMLVPRGDGWSVADGVDQVPVPGTVRALLDARLALLPDDQRAVLEAAAVVGKTFYPAALPHLVGEHVDVAACLEGLIRADLVVPADTDLGGYDAFAFNHLLVVDAAYQSLPKSRRARLHIDVARWLQDATTGQGVQAVATTHLDRALTYQRELGIADPTLQDEVVAALVDLARVQLVMGDARAARRYADRAVALSGDGAVEPLLVQVHAAKMAGDERVLELAVRAVEVAEQGGDASWHWRARLRLEGLRLYVDGDARTQQALELADQALAEVTDDHAVRAEALRLRATVHRLEDRYRRAADDAWQAAREAALSPPAPGRFEDLVTVVSLVGENGDASLSEAQEALDRMEEWAALDLAVRNDLRDTRLWVQSWAGDIEGALRGMLQRVEMLVDQGSAVWASSWLTSGIAWCYRWTGDAANEEAVLRRGMALRPAAGDRTVMSSVQAELGLLLARLGRVEEAEEQLRSSRDLSSPTDRYNIGYWELIEGCLAGRAGRRDDAELHFARGIELFASTEMLEQSAIAWLACCDTRAVLGDVEGALEAAQRALQLMRRKQFPVPIALIRSRIDSLSAELPVAR